jgi:hypothetical protein
MRAETIAMNEAVAARIDAALAARPATEAPQDGATLRAEFEARLAYARELSQDLNLAVDVAPGGPPIIGPLKRMLHELVVFYVNRLAARLEASRRQELAALEALARIVDHQQAEIDALRQGRE